MDIQDRICKYLAQCPPAIAGQAGHNQTFSVACSLLNGFALTADETLYYLTLYNERCQPKWSEKELQHKAEQADKAQHSKVRGHLVGGNGHFDKSDFKPSSFPAREKPDPKPVIDPATVIEIFLKGFRCAEVDISEASPVKLSENWVDDGALLLENLYAESELLNVVTDYKITTKKDGSQKAVPSGYGKTLPRNELMADWGLSGVPYSDAGGWFRMNPLDGKGIKDENVVAFRFILLEFDTMPLDLQISFLARIPLPIAAVLTSGGKSVHAWVKADCKDLIEYKDTSTMLLKMLKKYGLDAKNVNPSRLSRLVGAVRTIEAVGDGHQRLIYLNPNPEQKAIL